MPTTPTTDALDTAALAIYRRAAAVTTAAGELQQAARDLVLAAAQRQPGPAIATPAAPAQAAAVARGAPPGRQRAAKPTLAAGSAKTTRCAPLLTTAALMSLEQANLELAAAARYGAWRPSRSPSGVARSA